jgi:hypothetical protein
MRQVLHLLIVDPVRRAALAAHFGSRWLLPVLACGERVRADRHALRWVGGRGIQADVTGQWLGRVRADATDWLMVLAVTHDASRADPQLSWTTLDTLRSGGALLDYQGWAVHQSLERAPLPSVPGPFGRIGWTAEVRAWIAEVTGSPCACLVPFRTSAHEVVLGAHVDRGPVYFKGLMPERAGEARLTRTLAAFEPSHFARTLALEERAEGTAWWLTAGCPGRPAVDGRHVARALARVQRRVMSSGPVQRELPPLDLKQIFDWAASFVGDDRLAPAIEVHADALAHANVPASWIPMDLDPVNVLQDLGGEVRFIDLDDSFFGPAPLAMALFGRRMRTASLYRTYEQAWSPPLSGVDWPGFERAVTVVEAWLGWRRVARHTRRGEVHGALDIAAARIRGCLLSGLHGR